MSLQQITIDTIDKFGFEKAVKLMGYEYDLLGFFKKTKIEIPDNHLVKEDLIVDYVRKKYSTENLEYKGFKIYSSNGMTVEWYHQNGFFYATPWYGCTRCITLEWDLADFESRKLSNDYDGDDFTKDILIKNNNYENIDELINWFHTEYLELVYRQIFEGWNFRRLDTRFINY